MDEHVLITEYKQLDIVVKALDSSLRQEMLRVLYGRKLNISQLSELLGVHQSTCTVNIQLLEKAGLVRTETIAASKGAQKVCTTSLDEVVITLREGQNLTDQKYVETQMPIGLFTDFSIKAPCGLVSENEIIGYFDQTESFFHPNRSKAQLLWLSHGWIEYKFPKKKISQKDILALSVTMEVCSEFPGHNLDWPSDITVWINDVEIGTWCSPGDMGGVRGRLSPPWWSLQDTQYGFLKTWRVTPQGSFIDGEASEPASLEDLNIPNYDYFKLRIGVKDEAEHAGGLNIFGRRFGNYEHDIIFKVELDAPSLNTESR